MNSILIITHSTSNTGAPKICLSVIQFFKKKHPNLTIDVIAIESGGTLKSNFKELATNFISLDNSSKVVDYSFLNKIKSRIIGKKINSDYNNLISDLSSKNYELIFANTIVSLPLALKIKSNSLNSKILLYILEMNTVIDQLCPNFSILLKNVDKICYISSFHRKHVEDYYQIKSTNFKEIIPPIELKDSQNTVNFGNPNEFKIVMVGSVHWRKGDDVFIQIARKILLKRNDVHFYWIGSIDSYHEKIISNDIMRLGINKNVTFLGELENPHQILNKMDLFILTSREEPFGLAPAEAGLLKIPIIYFKGVTGIGSLLEDFNLDTSVPYLDIDKMEQKILSLIDDKELRETIGIQTKSILSQFDESKFWETLDECQTALLS